MTENLKSAIRTIAEYDKGWTNVNSPIYDIWEYTDEEGASRICRYSYIPYHTSADALLPVWRKVRHVWKVMNKSDKRNNVWLFDGLQEVRNLICDDYLPSACIKLAEIISQLNERK